MICLLPLDIPAKGTVLIVPQSHFGNVEHRKKGKLEDNISVSDRDDEFYYEFYYNYNGDESANWHCIHSQLNCSFVVIAFQGSG